MFADTAEQLGEADMEGEEEICNEFEASLPPALVVLMGIEIVRSMLVGCGPMRNVVVSPGADTVAMVDLPCSTLLLVSSCDDGIEPEITAEAFGQICPAIFREAFGYQFSSWPRWEDSLSQTYWLGRRYHSYL